MPSKTDAYFLLRLLQTGGIGPARVRSILDWLSQTETDCDAAAADELVLRQILSTEQLRSFNEKKLAVDDIWKQLSEQEVDVIAITSLEYPSSLRETLGRKAPPVLFVKGNKDLLNRKSVGFCGSRKASQRGLETASDAALQLSSLAINVVSGYAAGVDAMTHRVALENGGTTTCVLAEGIQQFRIKTELREVWDWSRTLVVSEFPPGLPWTSHNAMQRNETICGLSNAVIVIEAGENGGTLEAGKSALKLGVPLYVAVYEGSPESAAGNRILLELGARRLMKSRSENRAALADVVNSVQNKNGRYRAVSRA